MSNGEGSDSSGSRSDPPSNGRRRRRRRPRKAKRPGQSHTGAAAKQASGDGVPNAPSGGGQTEKNSDAVSHKPRAGKRSRRRGRGRKTQSSNKPGIHDCVTQQSLDPLGRETVSKGDIKDSKSKRRTTRRPRRKSKSHNRSGPEFANRGSVHHGQPYAALDLGTNNCRLLMAMPQSPGRFRVVDAFSRIVRLGEGLGASGRLSQEAMDRAVDALKACASKLTQRPVRGLRLIATEACRSADNGPQFLQRVHQEVGLKLETIDRETEARLAVAGCSSLVDPQTKGAVLFDIGGGSSELALIDVSRAGRTRAGLPDYTSAIAQWTSLPVGVVTLSERHGGGRNVTPAVFGDMVDEVSDMLAGFDDEDVLGRAIASGDVHLLGTSGTVTTLAGIHLGLPKYDRRQVDGIWMSVKQMGRIVSELTEMSYDERQQNPCIGRDRADLVLAGCAILMAIEKRWPCERLRVADRGLREGLLTQMMDADDAWLKDRPHRHQKGRR